MIFSGFTAASKTGYNLLSTTAYHAIAADTSTIITVPITTPSIVPAGSKLIVEIYHGSLQSASACAIGATTSGTETADSYDFSPPFGDTTPVSYESFGFGQYKVIIFGTGRQCKLQNKTPCRLTIRHAELGTQY